MHVTPMMAVHCRNLTKRYQAGGQEVMALRGVHLDIPVGQLMMLVGPSGCGKTTLINPSATAIN